MHHRLFFTFIIGLFTLSPLVCAAGIYKWYDESGQVNYTQSPPPKTAMKVEKPDGHISVLEPNWSPGMKRHASKFMNDAKVKRVWVNRDGKKVPGWY
jgi:hypothetical protein